MARFVLLPLVVWLILTVFTTVFAASANSNEVRVLAKWIWILLIVLLPVLGAILYLIIGRPTPTPSTKQIAPDDDPEFLRRLAEKLKDEDDKKDE